MMIKKPNSMNSVCKKKTSVKHGKALLFAFTFFVLFLPHLCLSQEIKVSSRLDSSNNIVIGDQLKLILQVECPNGTILLWPVIKDTIIKQIEVVNRSKTDSILSTDKKNLTLRQTFTVTSFDSGSYRIPPFEFNYRFKNDTSLNSVYTNDLFLNVTTIPVDTTKAIKDIKPPLKAPLTFREVLPFIITGIILAAVVLFIIYYIRRRRKNAPVIRFKKVRIVPAHETALLALQKLKDDKLWQQNKVKLYYVTLTDIIRKYIKERFEVDALEMTTDEIMMHIRKSDIADELKNKLKYMLQLADLVKFAKAQPIANEHDVCMANAFDFVNGTIPAIVIEEETEVAINDEVNHVNPKDA